MIIESEKVKMISSLPGESSEFKFKATAKAFKILSSNLYKNKILAVIRELSCNALDSHIAAKKEDIQFDIHLPTLLEPYFYVEDFGIGMSPEDLKSLYITFFDSTKSNSNDFVGALGLGSKSPFAYTQSFSVVSIWNGFQNNFICFINEDGIPSINQVGNSIKTNKVNGIKVQFAVQKQDISYFKSTAHEFFQNWNKILPNFTTEKIAITDKSLVLSGDNWKLFSDKSFSQYVEYTASVRQGPVVYPIDKNALNCELTNNQEFVLRNKFVIDFNIGELDIAPSREELSYDSKTVKNIVAKFDIIYEDFFNVFFSSTLENNNITFVDKIVNFNKIVSKVDIKNVKNSKLENIVINGKKYDSFNLAPEIKIDGIINFNINTHALKTHSRLTSTVHPNVEIYFDEAIGKFAFFNKNQLPPNVLSHQNYKKDSKFVSIIKLEYTENMCIYVNDMKQSSGFIHSYVRHTSKNLIIATSNDKYTESFLDEVKAFVNIHLNGCKVELLSTLTDYRVARVKIEKPKSVYNILSFYKHDHRSYNSKIRIGDNYFNCDNFGIDKNSTNDSPNKNNFYLFVSKNKYYLNSDYTNQITEDRIIAYKRLGLISGTVYLINSCKEEKIKSFGAKNLNECIFNFSYNKAEFEELSKINNFYNSNLSKLIKFKSVISSYIDSEITSVGIDNLYKTINLISNYQYNGNQLRKQQDIVHYMNISSDIHYDFKKYKLLEAIHCSNLNEELVKDLLEYIQIVDKK